MGGLVGFLADALAVVRLAVEARALWREWRGDGAEAEPAGGADRAGADVPQQAAPGDPPGEVHPRGRA